MKSLFQAVCALAVCAFVVPTWAGEGRWTVASIGGDPLFSVEVNGATLMLRCPAFEAPKGSLKWRWKEATGKPNYASAGLAQRRSASWSEPVRQFRIAVAGRTYDGPFDVSTDEGAQRFVRLAADLRQAPATVTLDGKTLTFPKEGASEVIPDEQAIRTACNGL